jgi:uncharacterized lipoprotein YddW (UPF0748 family)
MAQLAPAEPRLGGFMDYYLCVPEGIRYWLGIEKARHVDILMVSALSWGEAWYRGGKEPRAEELAAQPESFDPLQTALAMSHAAGMKVYATFDVGAAWNRARWPRHPKHVVNAHPEWLLVDVEGRVFPAPGPDRKRVFLNPGDPAACTWIHDAVLDVVKRYKVDGITLSELRYPGPAMGFSDEDLSRFRAVIEADLSREQHAALARLPGRDAWMRVFPARWARWRRDNVTGLLRRIYRSVKSVKPDLKVTAYVTAQGPLTAWTDSRAYNAFNEDWFSWMQEGIVDAVLPSRQYAHRNEYEGWVRAARENQGSAQVWSQTISDKVWDIIEEKNAEAFDKTMRKIEDYG